MQKKLPLIIALVLGAGAVFLANSYFRQKEAELAARARSHSRRERQRSEKVLVASKDIPQGARIDKTMLALKDVPINFIQPRATGSVERVIGDVAIAPISKGEQVLLSKVSSSANNISTLSYRTPPGKRAITVPVDNISSVGGMIRPNDYVDVLGVLPQTGEVGGKQVTQLATVPLFQKVLVLAVGSDLGVGPRRKEAKEKRAKANTITIALDPKEATMIAFVQEQGKLRFILRSPGDNDVSPPQPANWDMIFMHLFPEARQKMEAIAAQQQQAQKGQAKPRPKPQVEIYRGVKREVAPLH
ncbi:MAG: Flp pilus assembly protein CpaB [Candidatus Omnitrophota bacterium]